MTSRNVVIWTCDRCRACREQPMHNPDGSAAGMPPGWHRLDTRPPRLNVDVCDVCTALLWTRWWEPGFAGTAQETHRP